MDADRWDRIQVVFHEALSLAPADRTPFVRAQCADDETIARDVLEMLAEDELRSSLLDRGVGELAHDVLDGSVPALDTIGPYRILGVAGRGGMGVVYAAERDDLGSRAAIKVLRDATLSPLRRERFASEQRLLAQLDHPFIARLFDADTLPDGTPYFVMEYVQGSSLTVHARDRRLGVTQRLALFRDVCSAVQYAHGRAIIHRDIKPSNIMVRPDGAIKLLDFGIAKPMESLDTPADRTVTALRLMTPAYAAPEQVLGEPVGTFTDVYSLGAIQYELLTGRPPFDVSQLTPGQIERLIVDREPHRPSLAVRDTGAAADMSAAATAAAGQGQAPPDAVSLSASSWTDLDVLCRTAMHRDPQRRYRSVDALIRDVDHFLAREPLDARGDSVTYRVDRFLRRNWRPVATAAVTTMVVIALSVVYAVRLADARDAAVIETARARQIQQFVTNLFEGGDAEAGPADSLRVVTLLDRGMDEARVLDGEPRMQVDLYATLGGIYQKLGNLVRADSLLSLALERRRELFGDEHADVAASLVLLGTLRGQQATDLEEAERLVRDGLQMSRRTLPAGHPHIASATAALGQIAQSRGDYAESVAVFEEAVRLHGPAPTPDLARSLSGLASSHFYAGNHAASDSLNQRVLAMTRQLFGERHPTVADDLINLGAIHFEQGRYAEAEALYREALAIKLPFYGPDHHQTAANMTMLGRALVALERYDEAMDQLEPALRIREHVFGAVHPNVASTLNEIGTIAMYTDDFATAEASYRRMLDIYDAVYAGEHYLSGIALSNLSNVLVAKGDLAAAEATLRRTVDQFTRTLAPDHLSTGIAQIKLGRVIRMRERFDDAEPVLLAGYRTVSQNTEPGIAFLQNARTDLALVCDALGRPDEAERWREEHAQYAQQ